MRISYSQNHSNISGFLCFLDETSIFDHLQFTLIILYTRKIRSNISGFFYLTFRQILASISENVLFTFTLSVVAVFDVVVRAPCVVVGDQAVNNTEITVKSMLP